MIHKKDLLFTVLIILLFLPFFLIPSLYQIYDTLNRDFGWLMSFFKFAILATMGEALGLRIQQGVYNYKGFGLLPRAIVWGFLGIFIYFSFIIFAIGVPFLLEQLGWVWDKYTPFAIQLIKAFSISVLLNLIFAPVMMTLHKITDTHILQHQGALRALTTKIDVVEILKNLNWNIHWNLVLKKTIPFFWIPAHTITFLLPTELRILFAAFLGIVLGIILSLANRIGK